MTRAKYEKAVAVMQANKGAGVFEEKDYLATPSDPHEVRIATVNCDAPERDAVMWAGEMATLAVRAKGYLSMSVHSGRCYVQVLVSRPLDEQDAAEVAQ